MLVCRTRKAMELPFAFARQHVWTSGVSKTLRNNRLPRKLAVQIFCGSRSSKQVGRGYPVFVANGLLTPNGNQTIGWGKLVMSIHVSG